MFNILTRLGGAARLRGDYAQAERLVGRMVEALASVYRDQESGTTIFAWSLFGDAPDADPTKEQKQIRTELMALPPTAPASSPP